MYIDNKTCLCYNQKQEREYMKFDIILTELEDKDLKTVERTGVLTIPKGVTKIGKDACWGLQYLSELTIPEGVKFIDENAFGDCTYLSKVTLPKGLTSIYHNAFRGCTSLKEVYVHNTNEENLRGLKGLFNADTKIILVKENKNPKDKTK